MKKILLIIIALLTTASIIACDKVEYNLKYFDLEERISLGVETFIDESITEFSLGAYHSGIITSKGRIFLWGSNSRGELGNGTMEDSLVPVDITEEFDLEENETFKSLQLGEKFSFLLTSEGRVFSWGWNFSGRLADGTITSRSTPLEVTEYFNLNDGEKIESLNLGVSHGAVITSANRILTWGYNGFGQLGNGNINNSSLPIDITENLSLSQGEDIKQVALSFVNTMVLTSTGRVFAWGNNAYGQLGNESPYVGTFPAEITEYFSLDSTDKIEFLSMGMHHALALTDDNKIFSWGRNDYGQLGNNSTTNKNIPLNITEIFNLDDDRIREIHSGYHHNLVMTENGKIYVWGQNLEGQLGIGSNVNQLTPIVFSVTEGEINSVLIGYEQSAFILTNHHLFTWGKNNFGQLGNNSVVGESSPDQITGITTEEVEIKTEKYGENEALDLYTPEKSGYTFIGWYSDIDLEEPFNLTKMPSEDINLYAKWETNP
ncbi:MAG: InlB B-repeat-containing protein [Candidatus Izemoplasmatales bacterium]